jgi:hypothetical protein
LLEVRQSASALLLSFQLNCKHVGNGAPFAAIAAGRGEFEYQ